MAYLWQHTPKPYVTADAPLWWDLCHGDVTVHATNGFGSTPALSGSSLNAFCRQALTPGDDTIWSAGMYLMVSSLPATEKILLGCVDADLNFLACLSLLPSGQLAAYRGYLAELIGLTSAINTSTQYRVGVAANLAGGSSGRMNVDLDGDEVIDETGLNMGDGHWRGIFVGPGSDIFLSHLYAGDHYYTTPAYLVEWCPSSNANLDDASSDGDDTTEPIDEAGDQVITGVTGTSPRKLVYGVTAVSVVKGKSTLPAVYPVFELNGTQYLGDRQSLVLDDYKAVQEFRAQNPNTTTSWLGSQLAGIEQGVEGAA